MENQQQEALAGPAEGRRRGDRRGYYVPDVRKYMGICVVKAVDGNPNSPANQHATPEARLQLFLQFLADYGIVQEELETDFRYNQDQAPGVNLWNGYAQEDCQELAGMRREFYYLCYVLRHYAKEENKRSIEGNLKAIKKAIKEVQGELADCVEQVIALGGTPIRVPDVLYQEMVFPDAKKVKRSATRRR